MDLFPKGIANLGNTCYINACIQLLCCIDIFTNIVKQVPIRNVTKTETILWKNWKNIVSIMEVSSSETDIINKDATTNEATDEIKKETKQLVVQPNGFISAIEQVSKHKKISFFQPQEPQDISEYLLFFIDALHECISQEYDVKILGQSKNETDNLALEVYKVTKQTFEKQFSEVAKIFHGVQVSQLTSIDDQIVHSRNCEIFYLLDLPILHQKRAPYSIFDCLDEYTKIEILDGNNRWYNEKTKTHESVRKSLSFWSLPDVLIISLKRTQWNGDKNESQILYPLELDMRKYIIGYRKSEHMYDLKGVCIHIGGIMNGHYMAFVKKNEKWFFCNDEKVQIVEDTKHIQTNLAHCLFYVKKNTPL